MMLLLIDNYDSFTYNLAHLFGELGAEVVVRRNDEITADEAEALAPSHLVISPGPGRPEDAGVVARRSCDALAGRVPTLGVCLGHQAIVQVLRRRGRPGARARARQGDDRQPRRPRDLRRAARRTSSAGRYHSLAATSVPGLPRGLGDARPTAR